jgi:hypothetical protein
MTVDPYPDSPVLIRKIDGKDPRSKL